MSAISTTGNLTLSGGYVPNSTTTGVPSSGGTILNNPGYMYTSPVPDISNYSTLMDKGMNIEKLMSLPEAKRDILLDLFEKMSKSSDSFLIEFCLNTLDSYGILCDKDSLTRKVKIGGILDDQKNDEQ